MGKWTQGPWSVAQSFYVQTRDGSNVCNANYADVKERKANARLIAAAPELAEALKLWARWDDMTEAELALALEATAAALAKANGGGNG